MSWYAFRIRPQREQQAHDLLTGAGLVSLLVHEIRHVRRSRHERSRAKPVIVPLLTGYALARCDGPLLPFLERAFAVKVYDKRRGEDVALIRAVIGCDHVPTPIPDAAIAHLMAISGQTPMPPAALPIVAGGPAVLRAGHFAGTRVRVEKVHGKRAQVLLGWQGSARTVSVPLEHLEAA